MYEMQREEGEERDKSRWERELGARGAGRLTLSDVRLQHATEERQDPQYVSSHGSSSSSSTDSADRRICGEEDQETKAWERKTSNDKKMKTRMKSREARNWISANTRDAQRALRNRISFDPLARGNRLGTEFSKFFDLSQRERDKTGLLHSNCRRFRGLSCGKLLLSVVQGIFCLATSFVHTITWVWISTRITRLKNSYN